MIKQMIIALLCAAAFICAAATVSAEDIYIDFDAETGTIKNVYNPPMDVYEIPSEVDGVTVRKVIVDSGYENELNYVKKIIIPETVEEVDWYCGFGCHIEAVEVKEGNPYITVVDGVFFSKDMKTLICGAVPLSGEYVIPDGVQTIKNDAFSSQYDLDTIKIPDSVSVIEGGAISYCSVKLALSENNPNFCIVDDVLFSKDMKQLIYAPSSKTGKYTVPDSVEKICDKAFNDADISEFIFNDNLKEIGSMAFSFLYRTKGIRIPDSVTKLNDDSFFGSHFKWIMLPSSITSISTSMLRYMYPSNVYIPENITDIVKDKYFNPETFSGSCNVTIYAPSDSAAHRFAEENNIEFVPTDGMTADEVEKSFIEDTLKPDFSIYDGKIYLIENIHSKELVIPEEVDGEKVNGVYIEDFYTDNGMSIESIVIPDDNTEKLVFPDYKIIEKLILPDEVLIYPSGEVSYDIEISDSHKYYTKKDRVIYSKDMKTLVFCLKDIREKFTVPDGIEVISDNSFYMLKNLKEIKLPKSTVQIEPLAFCDCYDLETIDTSDNESFVFEDGVLFTADRKKLVWCSPKKTGSYTVPDTVDEIYQGAFIFNSLSEITVPESVKIIGRFAFAYSMQLNSLNLPDNMREIPPYMLFDAIIKKVTIPDGVKKIGAYAFSSYNIDEVYIPESVTDIVLDTGDIFYAVIHTPAGSPAHKFAVTNGISYVADGEVRIKIKLGENRMQVMDFEKELDVPPQIINDRTMVPLRAIFEALGAEVDWNGDTRTITGKKGDTTITMQIDNLTMTKNGVESALDTPPQIVNDRTLVPVRAIAESFDCKVDWDGATRTVTISLN